MKKFFILMSIAFSITMAVVIGTRISADAIAVIIGIICGVLASIPTSIMMIWMVRQRDRQIDGPMGQARFGQYPPVVVVNGQGGANGHIPTPTGPPLLTSPPPLGGRDFKVIGQENTDKTGDYLPPIWDQG
jgi:hypothetical protein